jgi:hypothetical protein
MAAIYEFHVAGQVGSVVRSALPEMEAFEQRSGRILHGKAAERREIDRLLELIQTFNLIVQRLQICVRPDPGGPPTFPDTAQAQSPRNRCGPGGVDASLAGARGPGGVDASLAGARSEVGGDVPVVDDGGAQRDVLQ